MLAKPSITEVLSYTQQIGAADLLAFAGGAIDVVPPPGDGKIIWAISACVIYNFNTVPFLNTPVLDLQFFAASDSVLPATIGGLVQPSYSNFVSSDCVFNAIGPDATSVLENVPLSLVLISGAFARGGVGSASVTAGGTGYAIGDTGAINAGGINATYQVLTVSGLGAVLTFKMTAIGSGYATGAGQATITGGAQPGVGINFTVDVLTIVNGDGSIKVTTLYQVIDVP